jgi:predicted SnoaL-like aldol condensation-catalyzing enzyme
MAPSRKRQVIDLLKSLETKDPVPFAYVNPNKYIQHNLQVGPGPAGVAALIKNCRPMHPSIRSASLKMATMSSLTPSTTSSGQKLASTSFASKTA